MEVREFDYVVTLDLENGLIIQEEKHYPTPLAAAKVFSQGTLGDLELGELALSLEAGGRGRRCYQDKVKGLVFVHVTKEKNIFWGLDSHDKVVSER